MSVYTPEPGISADGIVYADDAVQEGPNYKVTTAWSFTGKK